MVDSKELTKKQKEVFKYIYKAIRTTNLPPTIREIAGHFGFSSTGTVRDYLKALVNKGYLKISKNKSRAIELVRDKLLQVPVIGKVRAGLPSLAFEEIDGYLDLDRLIFSDDGTFALRVKGDSMIEAGILPEDLVLVKKQSIAQTGETVVALIGDEATVKLLTREDKNFYLKPANPNYDPIVVDHNVSIIGKVISVIRKMN
ncbi:MAG: transcriptional repressor LexA [Candidatus Omnitrophota bacterium]